ncbi:hypothetical protein [Paracoccus sp. SY]|uniref:hypothetical protein n=1 Tax=Paracoccus sp. SY TaxID=1330255 RepID=UPI000CD2DA8E|nr:hypothetical protein [Paracoccus sp. SY]
MTDLPIIPHTRVEPDPQGFIARPVDDTPEGHTLFQQSILEFSRTQTDWAMFHSQAGPYEAWDRVIFARHE